MAWRNGKLLTLTFSLLLVGAACSSEPATTNPTTSSQGIAPVSTESIAPTVVNTTVTRNKNTTVSTPAPEPEPEPYTPPVQQKAPKYSCDCSKTCDEISTCAEAQYLLNNCGCSRRDADHDGIACDTMCQ